MKIWFKRHVTGSFTSIFEAGLLGQAHLLLWALSPFLVMGVIHPGDSIGATYWLQGLDVPAYSTFTYRQMMVGELMSAILLAFIISLQFLVILFINRNLQYPFTTWLLAGILIGVIFNGFWWLYTGAFDPIGALVGTAPLALVVIIEKILQKVAQEFVFGKRDPQVIAPFGKADFGKGVS